MNNKKTETITKIYKKLRQNQSVRQKKYRQIRVVSSTRMQNAGLKYGNLSKHNHHSGGYRTKC